MTTAKTFIDNTDKQSTYIITSASALGVIYCVYKKKSFLQTLGITLGFALGGTIISIITNNLTDGE